MPGDDVGDAADRDVRRGKAVAAAGGQHGVALGDAPEQWRVGDEAHPRQAVAAVPVEHAGLAGDLDRGERRRGGRRRRRRRRCVPNTPRRQRSVRRATLVDEGGSVVVVVVDVVVVTSSTASPLGTVAGRRGRRRRVDLGDHLHRHAVERIGDEHHDARLGRNVRDLADQPGVVDDRHADAEAVERAAVDLDALVEVARRRSDHLARLELERRQRLEVEGARATRSSPAAQPGRRPGRCAACRSAVAGGRSRARGRRPWSSRPTPA